jgi:ketosteroid isomerase-like protein
MRNTNMHKTFLPAVMACLLALPVAVNAQEQPDAARVRTLEDQLTDAYRQRHVDVLATMLDDDFVITFEDGGTLSKTGYISFMAAPSDHVELAEMSDLKIRMHGTTSVVTGVYHEKGDTKGQPYDYHDRFTDIWKKKNGRWLLIASHYAVPLK